MSYFYMNREEKMAKEDKAKMPKLKITETVLRDGHQSLIATRMTTEEMLPILETMDQVGYNAVESQHSVLRMFLVCRSVISQPFNDSP